MARKQRKIIKVDMGPQFRDCPACGYGDGFHNMFEKADKPGLLKWYFICPQAAAPSTSASLLRENRSQPEIQHRELNHRLKSLPLNFSQIESAVFLHKTDDGIQLLIDETSIIRNHRDRDDSAGFVILMINLRD
jgi:hypothetical protein